MTERTQLYPDIEPYDTGMLRVSDLHQLYYEQCGNQQGNPVIYLHGGPGGCTGPGDRTFFDPAVYRIILMDQRGAGKSTPPAELRENTTWDLVSDLEKLRIHLGVSDWVVFGSSWGSTLALAYSQTHPDRVKAIIMSGIFMVTRRELSWFDQFGASMIFPDYWEDFIKPIPEVERGDLLGAYHRRLTSDDPEVRKLFARAWNAWELITLKLHADPAIISMADQNELWSLQHARIECHYFIHGGFFETEGQLLANVDRIRHIPTTIIQGRYDIPCPMETAWKLNKVFPEAEFHIVPDAGHAKREPGIQALLLAACEKYKHL